MSSRWRRRPSCAPRRPRRKPREALRNRLEAAEEEAAAATRALAVAEEAAAGTAKEVGLWRQRAQIWKRRAAWWRGQAGGEEDCEAEGETEAEAAEAAAVGDSVAGQSDALSAVALLAIAERGVLARERDEAVAKWSALLAEKPKGDVSAAPQQSDGAREAAAVWREEAVAWAAAEAARLKATYRSRWEA